MSTYESLERSTKSLFNKSIFLSVYNDLIIYVEDIDLGAVYEKILNRIFENNIKFDNIYLSGGKGKVKEMYEKYKMDPIVPSFFIVDLDYDNLLEKEIIKDDNFLYLNRYSIENYLLNDSAAINILNPRLNKGIKECSNLVSFDNWLNKIEKELKFLNSLFLSVQYLGLGIENTKKSAESFLHDRTFEIDQSKIDNYYLKVCEVAKEVNKLDELKDCIDRYNSLQDALVRHTFPGKILLKIFYHHILNLLPVGRKQLYINDFYYNSADQCDIQPLQYIKENVEKYLMQYN